jgi:membrane protein implicated in regulation of membrane protease activity
MQPHERPTPGIIAWLVALISLLLPWAHPTLSPSDEPELNRRGAQLKGRTLELSSPIEGGRGLVRCDDTVWQVEGPDLPAGCRVKVVGVAGMLLRVEPL